MEIQERRTGIDRRRHDYGPPQGWRERRRHAEQRIPAVAEAAISDDEWLRYFGNSQHSDKTPSGDERAAEILGRIRD